MDGYPFTRQSKSRCDGWEAYHCQYCDELDYAAPDSEPFAKCICVDCDVAGVKGISSSSCNTHGAFRLYSTTRYPDGQGSCPQCARSTHAKNGPPDGKELLMESGLNEHAMAIADILGGTVTPGTVAVLENWARLEPSNANPWTHLSEALIQIALAPANRGLVEVKPSYLWTAALHQGARMPLVVDRSQRAVWERAIAAVDKAAELDPQDTDPLRQRALIALLWEEDKRKARQLAEHILALKPDQFQAKKILEKVPHESGPCFVATAAFGSEDAQEVLVFRRFRDQVLSRSRAGRTFIRTYYRIGPLLANQLEGRPVLTRGVRFFLRVLARPGLRNSGRSASP